jgi:hypothetical protein
LPRPTSGLSIEHTRQVRSGPTRADIDSDRKGLEDDAYENFPVNHLNIDKTPGAALDRPTLSKPALR